MARYRLRFLLQEFDLPRGTTLIGRSLDCHVTIEDPLVSRQHARVLIDDDGARIEDLGSRNGVKVNGVTVRGTVPLKDGDRLRIGTQDLVFCHVDPIGAVHAKTTGVLRLCANCRLPYPREMVACPNCEATEQTEEETLSGSFGAEKQHSWSVQLLVEALEKALALGRHVDAERILRRATAQVEEIIASGAAVDRTQLGNLAVAAAKTSLDLGDPTWCVWSVDVYKRARRAPTPAHVDQLAAVAAKYGRELVEPIGALIAELSEGTPDDADAIARLERLRALLSSADTTQELPVPERPERPLPS